MKKNIVYVFTSCKRSGPIRIMYNLILNLDRNKFNPILVTLYDEEDDSLLNDFLALGINHYKIHLSKKEILLGKTKALKDLIKSFSPSIIHSMGVFPDYAVSRMKLGCQMITLHNYMHEDYFAKFGCIKGFILEKLQMYAVFHSKKVVTCSESLAKLYKDKKRLNFDFIRNGVDTTQFDKVSDLCEKKDLRAKLGLPQDKLIFVYSGQFIERKNQKFILDTFSKKELNNCLFVFLGDGVLLPRLRTCYSDNQLFVFLGNVANVQDYLKASDFYISSSVSEGLPTGVLEAMACGLPVILSNIPQHKEIIDVCPKAGLLFVLNSSEDCLRVIDIILKEKYSDLSNSAYNCGHEILDARTMANNYQHVYSEIGM